MNQVTLLGFAGGDAILRETKTGKKVANFSLATSEKYGEKETTAWHKVVAWEGQAEHATFIKKGDRVFVTGKISYRSYEDKTGAKKDVTEIVAFNVGVVAGSKRAVAHPQDVDFPRITDDIPF